MVTDDPPGPPVISAEREGTRMKNMRSVQKRSAFLAKKENIVSPHSLCWVESGYQSEKDLSGADINEKLTVSLGAKNRRGDSASADEADFLDKIFYFIYGLVM